MTIPNSHHKKKKKKYNCILLIDDDPIANYLHLKLFNNLKIAKRIDIVTNGEEALNYINEVCHPELIFLDINMPVMDGIEFLMEFKKLNPVPEIIIYILTTSEHSSDVSHIKKLGVQDYLNKPLTEEKLNLVMN